MESAPLTKVHSFGPKKLELKKEKKRRFYDKKKKKNAMKYLKIEVIAQKLDEIRTRIPWDIRMSMVEVSHSSDPSGKHKIRNKVNLSEKP